MSACATRRWWALTAAGVIAVAAWATVAGGVAVAQQGDCVATGTGTAWALRVPGLGAVSAGIAVGAPGAPVVALSVGGYSGRTSTSGLPAGTTLEFFSDVQYPVGQPFTVNVTTGAPVSAGSFTAYPINASQTGYLAMTTCAIQVAAPVPASPQPVTPASPAPGPVAGGAQSSDRSAQGSPGTATTSSGGSSQSWLWAGLAILGLAVVGTGVVASRTRAVAVAPADDDGGLIGAMIEGLAKEGAPQSAGAGPPRQVSKRPGEGDYVEVTTGGDASAAPVAAPPTRRRRRWTVEQQAAYEMDHHDDVVEPPDYSPTPNRDLQLLIDDARETRRRLAVIYRAENESAWNSVNVAGDAVSDVIDPALTPFRLIGDFFVWADNTIKGKKIERRPGRPGDYQGTSGGMGLSSGGDEKTILERHLVQVDELIRIYRYDPGGAHAVNQKAREDALVAELGLTGAVVEQGPTLAGAEAGQHLGRFTDESGIGGGSRPGRTKGPGGKAPGGTAKGVPQAEGAPPPTKAKPKPIAAGPHDPFVVQDGVPVTVQDEVNTAAVYVHAQAAWEATFPEILPERAAAARRVPVVVTDQAGLNAEFTANCGKAPDGKYPAVRLTAADGSQKIVTTTDNAHIAAHEVGHTLQNPDLKGAGAPVYEAFNEKFTQDLCTKRGVRDMKVSSYEQNGNVAAVGKMEELVGPQPVREANFGSGTPAVENLKAEINRATAPGTAEHVFNQMNAGNGWEANKTLQYWIDLKLSF